METVLVAFQCSTSLLVVDQDSVVAMLFTGR
jgi:hypothetical protein